VPATDSTGLDVRGGIRFRITTVATLAVTIVLVVTGVALLASQRRILTNNLDEILQTENAAIEHDHDTGSLVDPIVDQGDEDAIAQVVDGSGQVVASTPNLQDHPPLDPPRPGATSFRTVALTLDEGRYRLMSRSVGGVVIHTGTPIDDVEDSVTALRRGLLVAIPVVVAILGLLVWWLVGRTLRPVEVIRSQVASITGASLDRRVSEPGSDDEIARLARTMNSMLDRVEDASRRQQEFVADASHELRTPLTRMQAELEVDLAHPETADLPATHRSVLDEVTALHRLVDDLLRLARSDAGDGVVHPRLVDIDQLLLAEADRLRMGSDAHIDTSRVTACQVTGDPAELVRAVRNLCDNAVRHAASTVTLRCEAHDGVVEIGVADDGPGVPEDQRARVFERFSRIDRSRAAASGGTGLGLPITLDIIRRHGGSIVITDADGGGAAVTVSLPVADGDS